MELVTKNMYMLQKKCEAVNQITFDEDLNVPDVKPDIGRMIQKKGDIHVELVTKNMYMLQKKCEAVNQITFDEDLNVPDVKPDIGRMIQKKGDIQLEDIQISEGRAYITGALVVSLLYVSDNEERRLQSLMGTLRIGETLNLEGLESGDKVQLKWDIEDLSVQLINSRKLNIKALVTFTAYVEESKELELPVAVEDDEISQKKEDISILGTVIHKKDTMRVKEDISLYVEESKELELPVAVEDDEISQKKEDISILGTVIHKKDTMRVKEDISLSSNKPDIYELLWNTVEVRGLDIRAENDKIAVKGELFVFALYSGNDDNNSLQWLEHSVPFYQELECVGCTQEMIPNVEISMPQGDLKVKQDEDGEERVIGVDVVLELELKIYEEEELSLLMDVYTPLKECEAVRENQVLESLLVKNFSKCKVNDRIKIENSHGKILQICHSDGNVKVDSSRIVENGIEVEGVVQIRILYIIGDDDMPFYSMETMIPFRHIIEAEQITENCVYYMRADLEQLSTTMIDSDEIEAKIVINLNALVMKQRETGIIQNIEERELDREKLRNMPGIVGYQVQPQDTLWDIAKRFYTTIDTILELNEMENETIKPYDTLVLMKKVEK